MVVFLSQRTDLRVRQERESPVCCRVMNIITSAKSFKNNARYLKNLAKVLPNIWNNLDGLNSQD